MMFIIGGLAAALQPIRLEVESESGARIIRVVASSPVECTATYTLEVAGGGGGNTSVNRGTVTIAPSKPATLATVRLGGKSADGLSARLDVDPCGGERYQQQWPPAH